MVGYATLASVALAYVPSAETGASALVAVSLLLGFVPLALQPMYRYGVAEYSPPGTRGLSDGYTYRAQFGVGALGAAVVGTVLTYADVSRVRVANRARRRRGCCERRLHWR